MQSKEKPVTLIYKGSITQSTGEDWDDVPLTLETATPTFGVGVPTLTPWTISVYRPSYAHVKYKAGPGDRFRGGSASMLASAPGAPPPAPMASRMMDMDVLSSSSEGQMQHRGLQVSSKGNVSATFGVPGLINIPSDGVGHSVTIVKLELDATMSWVCVPKKDGKVHLKVCLIRRRKLFKRWILTPGQNRQRSRTPLSTRFSLETPVYTSTGVSSPSQMCPLLAQTRVSTVLSGMRFLILHKTYPH